MVTLVLVAVPLLRVAVTHGGDVGTPPLHLVLLGADRNCSQLLWLGFAGTGIPWAPVPVGDQGGRVGIISRNVCA